MPDLMSMLNSLNPYDSYYASGPTSASFSVYVDGTEYGRFREVSGLEVQIEIEEVKEGGQNGFVHKLPGRRSFSNLTLRRGITKNNGLIEWMMEAAGDDFDGNGKKLARKTMALVLNSSLGLPLRIWAFEDAFPVRWSGPDFSLNDDDFITEELEIAHNGFTVKNV